MRMQKDFIDSVTFAFKMNDFLTFLLYFMNFFHQLIFKWWDHKERRPTRQKKAQTPYCHLSKLIKWSLKFYLSISQSEVTHEMTPKSALMTILLDDNHLMDLSDHLMDFIMWKYEIKPLQIRFERPHRCSHGLWRIQIVKSIEKYAYSGIEMIKWLKSLK